MIQATSATSLVDRVLACFSGSVLVKGAPTAASTTPSVSLVGQLVLPNGIPHIAVAALESPCTAAASGDAAGTSVPS